jgi:hypothetical protein
MVRQLQLGLFAKFNGPNLVAPPAKNVIKKQLQSLIPVLNRLTVITLNHPEAKTLLPAPNLSPIPAIPAATLLTLPLTIIGLFIFIPS